MTASCRVSSGWGGAARWYGSAAAVALLLAAACGGERQPDPGADTAGAAGPVTPPRDTVVAVVPDTGADLPAVTDTSSAVPEPGSAVARRTVSDTAADTTARQARAPAPPPVAQQRDTQAAAPAAPAAAPAPPPQPAAAQDTPRTQAADTAPADSAPAEAATAAQPAQDQPLRDPYHQPPRDTVSQEVYDGWKQYNLNCARCHGEDVLGTTIAPHLIMSVKPDGAINTKEAFIQVVCAGRPEKGMPAWCPLGMEMEKINQIYSYVKGRSDGEIGPGRPALREEG